MPGKKNTHCGVKKCPSNVSGHRMSVYGIPEDRLIKRKWLKAMKKASFGSSAGVCERHFTGMYWSRKDKSSHNDLVVPQFTHSIFFQMIHLFQSPKSLTFEVDHT